MSIADVRWLEGLFDDVTTRIRTGVTWTLDRSEVPLTVHVRPADRPMISLPLSGDGSAELRAFATALQNALNPLLGTNAPPCPTHGMALEALEEHGQVRWRCTQGDFSCLVGDYREALWPPGPEEPQENLGSLLGHHLERRGVMRGVAAWSVRREAGALVGGITLRPAADEAAIREAAAPVALHVTHIGPITTVRVDEPADDRERARRTLRIGGKMAVTMAARLHGIVRRATPEEGCDFIVEAGKRRVRVRLRPEHRCGDPGEPVLFDHNGDPFADDGDEVTCGGGHIPTSRVEGEPGLFHAGIVSVYELDQPDGKRAAL
ncbi:MAG: hypothetical protein M0Z46_10850 [Actinomycetota bacterium]|nr:hypothetical protein [Actinomycetota bacterium]